jgi:hypothetical protein
MARPAFDYPNDVTVYLVEEDFGHLGRAYLETDAAEADRETIVRNFISGQYKNAKSEKFSDLRDTPIDRLNEQPFVVLLCLCFLWLYDFQNEVKMPKFFNVIGGPPTTSPSSSTSSG